MATTWEEIVDRAAGRVDMSESEFVDPDQWLEFARDAYRKLHNILAALPGEEYFSKPSDPITIDGDGIAAVPADFQRLHAVDIKYGSEWIPLKGKTQSERSNSGRLFHRRVRSMGYRLMSRSVYFYPSESSAGMSCRLWYTPLPEKLPSLSGDIPVEMERWSDFLVLECAIMAVIKEETDDSQLVREREILRSEIREQGMARMMEDPGGIEDVRDDDTGYGFYREDF